MSKHRHSYAFGGGIVDSICYCGARRKPGARRWSKPTETDRVLVMAAGLYRDRRAAEEALELALRTTGHYRLCCWQAELGEGLGGGVTVKSLELRCDPSWCQRTAGTWEVA